MSVKIVDNTNKFLDDLGIKKKIIYTSWGEIFESHAKQLARVDTGNMRNGITYEVDFNKVVCGDTVDYSVFVESKFPFIKPAIENHIKEYEDIAKKLLK